MSDANINIDIQTQGADAAAGEFKKLERELSQLRAELKKIPTDSESFNSMAAKVGAAETKLKSLRAEQNKVTSSGLNMRSAMQGVGFQIQDMAVQAEMGTSAMRIVSQQVPQMLGAFGPWGAVAGTVVALGVPMAAALGLVGKSAGDAAPSVDKLTESYEGLLEAYKGIEKATIQEIEDEAKKSKDGLDQKLSGIDRNAKVSLDLNTVAAAKESAAATLELARQRSAQATIESALTLATGQNAVNLAREREKIIGNIYALELKISDVGRNKKEEDATTQQSAATQKYIPIAEEAAKATSAYEAKQSETEAIRNQANDLYKGKIERLPEIEKRLTEISNATAGKQQGPIGGNALYSPKVEGLNKERAALISEVKTINQNASEAMRLAAEANSKDDTLAKLEGLMIDATKAQNAAAQAMINARGNLATTKETNAIEKGTEVAVTTGKKKEEIGEDFTGLAEDTIGLIQEKGLNKNPGIGSEVEAGLTKLITDTTPDADQGKSILGLIQSLQNNLTTKDQGLINSISKLLGVGTNLLGQLKDLERRIIDLEGKTQQKR